MAGTTLDGFHRPVGNADTGGGDPFLPAIGTGTAVTDVGKLADTIMAAHARVEADTGTWTIGDDDTDVYANVGELGHQSVPSFYSHAEIETAHDGVVIPAAGLYRFTGVIEQSSAGTPTPWRITIIGAGTLDLPVTTLVYPFSVVQRFLVAGGWTLKLQTSRSCRLRNLLVERVGS